ncbi:MAG TPA: hypothetical protein VFC18_03045 [Burkholderiales bacterium]|nr:hypothetical protein [Burkholderiales bacterium]
MRTLRQAQLAAGGISDLAARLDVAVFELTRWIEGEARPPEDVYDRAQEIAKGHPEG